MSPVGVHTTHLAVRHVPEARGAPPIAILLAERTAVVVAHRLTQARECDRIAVVADGLGTHDDLVAPGGRYADLWSAWSRRY